MLTWYDMQWLQELSLPGLGQFELAGVVYHSGRKPTSGHYTCACRGPDRMFWRANDKSFTRATLDVERILPKQVYLAMYTKPRGSAVFCGMGDGGSAPACSNASASSSIGGAQDVREGCSVEAALASSSTEASSVNAKGSETKPCLGPEVLLHTEFQAQGAVAKRSPRAQSVGAGAKKRRRSTADAEVPVDVSAGSPASLSAGHADTDLNVGGQSGHRAGGSFLKRRRGTGRSVE